MHIKVDKVYYYVRQLMVMDETHVVNQMKEDTCYVTSDFCANVETARSLYQYI